MKLYQGPPEDTEKLLITVDDENVPWNQFEYLSKKTNGQCKK